MGLTIYLGKQVYSYERIGSITHNLVPIAKAAGLYECLWHPEEIGASKARDLIGPLELGIKTLKINQDLFRKLSPANGFGTYDGLLSLATAYLIACREQPDSDIHVEG